jgi:hypothetical protein
MDPMSGLAGSVSGIFSLMVELLVAAMVAVFVIIVIKALWSGFSGYFGGSYFGGFHSAALTLMFTVAIASLLILSPVSAAIANLGNGTVSTDSSVDSSSSLTDLANSPVFAPCQGIADQGLDYLEGSIQQQVVSLLDAIMAK